MVSLPLPGGGACHDGKPRTLCSGSCITIAQVAKANNRTHDPLDHVFHGGFKAILILAPPLARFAAMPERNMAIVQAFAPRCYRMMEIAQAFEIHYDCGSDYENDGRFLGNGRPDPVAFLRDCSA